VLRWRLVSFPPTSFLPIYQHDAACVQLAINDISPSPHTLGTLTAISLIVTSALRAIAPALFTTLFAVGVRDQILRGYFVWLLMAIIAVIFTATASHLPKKAEGKFNHNNHAA
jgi:hypothetical protein